MTFCVENSFVHKTDKHHKKKILHKSPYEKDPEVSLQQASGALSIIGWGRINNQVSYNLLKSITIYLFSQFLERIR